VLVLAGLLLASDVIVTLVWQEPLSAVVAGLRRDAVASVPPPLRLSGLDRQALAGLRDSDGQIAFLARAERATLRAGEPLGRIAIPRIGLSSELFEGTGAAALQLGPGHYPGTGLPGEGTTVALAGHRTTFLAPFRHIDELRRGDPIVVTMPYGTFDYVVEGARVVAPTAWWVIRPVGEERLVLSACTPLFSASKRLVVFARLQQERLAPGLRAPQLAPGREA
jgi:sortase A